MWTACSWLILCWPSSFPSKGKTSSKPELGLSLRATSRLGSSLICTQCKEGSLSFPFELIAMLTSGVGLHVSSKMLKLAQLHKLFRLFRIMRLRNMTRTINCGKKCSQRIRMLRSHSGIMRMLVILVYVVFSLHLITCMWVVTSKMDDYHPDTWLVRTGAVDMPPTHQYLISLYWAFQTVTTVGFGDIAAITISERVLALFWMVFGVGFYSFTVGNLTSILGSLDAKSAVIRVSRLSNIIEQDRLVLWI